MTGADESAIYQEVPQAAPGPGAQPGGPELPPDAELVAAARADPRAFDAVYRRYLPRVYRYARARMGSQQDAEDVTAATFIEAFNGLAGYTEQGRFGPWLFTIARRQVLAHRRRHPVHEDVDALRLAGTPTATGEAREQLLKAIGRLSEDRREALMLRFYADLKVTEVAAVLGKGESAVKMLLHRGLAQLAEILGEDPRDA